MIENQIEFMNAFPELFYDIEQLRLTMRTVRLFAGECLYGKFSAGPVTFADLVHHTKGVDNFS